MSRRSRQRPVDLAREAGLEVDDVLILMWDAGFDEVVGPEDEIPSDDVKRARLAIGMIDSRTLRSPTYWQDRLRLDEAEWQALMSDLDISMSASARRLPKGAVSRLRRFERQKFGQPLDPPTSPAADPVPEFEELVWRTIGHEGPVARLCEEDVEGVHWTLVREFKNDSDPISPPGIRSEHLLGSAVYRQNTSNGGIEKYPTPEMSAAALFHSLVVDHPFHNGNKRTAVVAAACLLYENRLRLTCTQDALFKVVVETAQGSLVDPRSPDLADREVLHLAEWFRRNSRVIDRRSRVMTWLKFKRALREYNVEWEMANVGNRINLHREFEETSGFLKRTKLVRLSTQVAYTDDGREAEPNVIDKVRHDLHLDERHGVDAGVFFDQKEQAEDVIVAYQRTLRRLART